MLLDLVPDPLVEDREGGGLEAWLARGGRRASWGWFPPVKTQILKSKQLCWRISEKTGLTREDLTLSSGMERAG